ncbi:hypothetical protein ACLOJK_021031 [Asimina triloba]
MPPNKGGGRAGEKQLSIYSSLFSCSKLLLYPWASFLGPTLASFMVFSAMAYRFLPPLFQSRISRFVARIFLTFDPYIDIKIDEYTGERLQRSDAYVSIQAYLREKATKQAKRLKAESIKGKTKTKLELFLDENEQITDEFRGAKMWWLACSRTTSNQAISVQYPTAEKRRYYKLSFHQRHRGLVVEEYLPHLIKEGKRIKRKSTQRKLFMNSGRGGVSGWSHVVFNHPATFQTLAMDPEKKQEIIQDLISFRDAKNYYAKIGKAWKRGYLLHGPPGTGKSTMVAAMSNFLEYNVYDLELTAVKDNTELRRLLIDTTSRSIIVIEDIDCSIDLSGKRETKSSSSNKAKDNDDDTDGKKTLTAKKEEVNGNSQVTLSGLLNFIDGLWSACGDERIIVFTTNFVEKLDPALIRRGRMDKHIEMSYCSFEGFKVLAKNYLDLDSHPLFEDIRQLIQVFQITPADVAENLMPKSSTLTADENSQACLSNLIRYLRTAKEEVQSVPVSRGDDSISHRQEPETAAAENSSNASE